MGKKQAFLTSFLVTILIATNAILIWPLFTGEYDRNVASIGIAHILNGRYLADFWQSAWNPYWYGGFPNHLIYPLLAPLSLALVQKLTFGFLSMPQVYRGVVAVAYVLTPVTLFFLVRYFTKRNLIAFFGALFYFLAPSANYFLIPGFRGLGEKLYFAPWQLSVITDYGEGPHIIALALAPLAIIAYWRLLRQPSFYKLLLAAFLMGLVVSINLFSACALGYFLLGVFLSEFVLGKSKEKLFISLLLIPLVYGLIAYCYDLSMLVSLSKSGYIHPENTFHLPPVTNLFLILIFIAGPLLFAFYELFKNKSKLQNGLVLGIWFLIFWAIPYAFYRGYWFGSQPNRYMPELNMTVAILGAAVLVWVYDWIVGKLGILGRVGKVGGGAILLGCYITVLLYWSQGFIRHSWEMVAAHPDIKSSSEYKVAKWLGENINYESGERAYLTGSPAFFFNEFADVPQLRGDEDNAQADPWWADVVYQVNAGTDGQLALGWLEAYNVRFAVVDFGASTPYKDFKYPDKFSDLETLAEIDGFKIMEIPGQHEIIQAVDLTEVERLKPFSHPIKRVLDKEGLLSFLEATREPLGVQVEYTYAYRQNPDLAVVKVKNANQKTGILFKSTYDSGWRARLVQTTNSKQQRVEIIKTGPDLMLVKPKVAGDYTLELSYHRPLVEYLGYGTTLATLIIIAFLIIKKGNFRLEFLKEQTGEKGESDEEND